MPIPVSFLSAWLEWYYLAVLSGFLRTIFFRLSVHHSHTWEREAENERRHWWEIHRRQFALKDIVLIGPAGAELSDWLRVIKREHQAPLVRQESLGNRCVLPEASLLLLLNVKNNWLKCWYCNGKGSEVRNYSFLRRNISGRGVLKPGKPLWHSSLRVFRELQLLNYLSYGKGRKHYPYWLMFLRTRNSWLFFDCRVPVFISCF